MRLHPPRHYRCIAPSSAVEQTQSRTGTGLGSMENGSRRWASSTCQGDAGKHDPKSGTEKQIIVDMDDGIRPETSMAILSKLKAVFKKDGSTTAGNASQVSDGAGAVLLMRRDVALQKGLPILAVFSETLELSEDISMTRN